MTGAATLAEALRRHRAGDLENADRLYRDILDVEPGNADALHLCGVVAHQRGRRREAIELIERAIALNPRVPDFHNALGEALRAGGQLDAAIRQYRQALDQDRGLQAARCNLALALIARGDLGEAEAVLAEVLATEPRHIKARNILGMVLKRQGRLEQALAQYRGALDADPHDAESHVNLGNLLSTIGRLDEAVVEYGRAIEVRPDLVEARDNLGVALKDLGRLDEAIARHRQAIALAPDYAEAHKNLGLALLLGGDFADGFDHYDWRWRIGDTKPRAFPQPRWTGAPLTGGPLLVWGEQGIGDEVMFASALNDAIAAAGRVIVECGSRLVPLLARSFAGAEIVARAASPDPRLLDSAIAAQCPAGDLCRWLRRDAADFARPAAYLKADPERRRAIRRRYDALSPGVKIGIAWRSLPGRRTLENARYSFAKSAPLSAWGPVLGQAKALFVNLQYGDCGDELAQAERDFGVRIHDDREINQLESLDDFAAQIAALDLVITTSNTAAHIAGALGQRVWTLLSHVPDWRWQLGREDTLWYPRMRLFRQPAAGDWRGVIARLGSEIERLAAAGQAG